MEPIDRERTEAALMRRAGRDLYVHLETTSGAYTQGGFGAFARNVRFRFRRATVAGGGPYRVGLEAESADGWIYAEGLTDWEEDVEGRLLLAGFDKEGRLTVACELSLTPFLVSPPVAGWQEGRQAESFVASVEPPTVERAVLVVHAHPDDETFACGGTIARYAYGGVPVTVVCATRGEQGRNMGRPRFAHRESLPNVRVQELEAACRALGVREVHWLGVWDKTAEFLDPDELARRIVPILRAVRPSLVITAHPEHGGHPDHCAVGRATVRAVRSLPTDARPRVHATVSPRLADRLDVRSVDIGPVCAHKLAAIAAHRSQSGLAPKEPPSQEHYVVLEV